MRARLRMLALPALALASTLQACGALESSVSQRFLLPRDAWLAEPSDLGLPFEEFELPTGEGTSVHGWFVPAEPGDGRTVVICHGNGANITFYHPYYSFLQAAGWNVLLFDYRGYGRSQGELDVSALFSDAEAALDHALALPAVDPDRVVLFGASLGSIVALRTAARRPEVRAVVAESVSSPRAVLRRGLGSIPGWLVRSFALPGGIEPADNAAEIARPQLFLSGAWDADLTSTLEAFAAAEGPAACWVLPDTAHAPNPLLVHDGEYQAAILRFYDAALEGRNPRVDATVLSAREGWLAVRLTRRDIESVEPLPVQLCVVGEDGQPRFTERWMFAAEETWELQHEGQPASVTAWPYLRVLGTPEQAYWSRAQGPLARAADARATLLAMADIAASSEDPLEVARSFLETLAFYEQRGAFPPLLQTELIPAWLTIGEALLDSSDPAERAAGLALLERCVAAAPEVPGLHYWPSSPYIAGFQHQAAVERARDLLEAAPYEPESSASSALPQGDRR